MRSFAFFCIVSFFFSLATRAESSKNLPDISINALGLLQHGTNISSDRSVANHNGFQLQEAELQFTSDVDAYLRASALFSVAPKEGSEFGFEPEEVYIETISLPHVTLRAGKFKLAFGRHNQLHTHAFPFIDAPLIHQTLLGDEGLNEMGLSAAVLLPFSWFSELTYQGYTLGNEQLFRAKSSGDFGSLLRLKNLWELNDDWTFELGASALSGANEFRERSSVLGGDLTLKWRPSVGGKYHSFQWSTEYLNANRVGRANDVGQSIARLGGAVSYLQYQFSERWWAQARYEFVGLTRSDVLPKRNKQSALIGFFPSEFSGFRVQYDRIHDPGRPKTDHAIALQYNISIGTHPAHAY